ncbi:MAG: CocE/NonD family hydrolase [Anaerolineae bacterium]|nr:CocE/NonD family hydrolase [Anaerolineae bacterium]MDW8171813.1 CocE/NonD family hydrolase [Anaerolineae bacterium]
MLKRRALLGLFLLLSLPLLLWRWRAALWGLALGLGWPRQRLRIVRGLRLPTSDGLLLACDHYAPRRAPRGPTLLIRTPYGRNGRMGAFGALTDFCARRFAERGYHVIVQDVRGRFDSQGAFSPYENERADGLATLAWLRQQDWYDGRVYMWGPSYLGIVQWAIADAPDLAGLMPLVTSSRFERVALPDGVLDLGLALRWAILLHLMEQPRYRRWWGQIRLLRDMERRAHAAWASLPVANADLVALGQPVSFYRESLTTMLDDPQRWQARFASPNLGQVRASVHLVGAWHDFFLRGMLDDYVALRRAGQRPRLTIHAGHHFSQLSMMLGTLRDAMRGFAQADSAQPKVRLMVQRLGWRSLDDYPPPHQPRPFYLAAHGKLDEDRASGEPDEFIYDPADPTPAWGGPQFGFHAARVDGRKLEARSDTLSYTSAPLADGLTAIGAVRVVLVVRSSRLCADFYARLSDVYPDGRSLLVCDGLARLDDPQAAEALGRGLYRLTIDLWATAYRWWRGHRLRLLIGGGAHPRWARQLGGADRYRSTELMPSERVIYHDEQRPSFLLLPWVSD